MNLRLFVSTYFCCWDQFWPNSCMMRPFSCSIHSLILHRRCFEQNRLKYRPFQSKSILLFSFRLSCHEAGRIPDKLSSKEKVEGPLSIRGCQGLIQDTKLREENYLLFCSFRQFFSWLKPRVRAYCQTFCYEFCWAAQKGFSRMLGWMVSFP